MKQETKQRLLRFIIILGCAVIVRIIVLFIAPVEMQPYVSLGVLIAAVASFFIWEVIREQKKDT